MCGQVGGQVMYACWLKLTAIHLRPPNKPQETGEQVKAVPEGWWHRVAEYVDLR